MIRFRAEWVCRDRGLRELGWIGRLRCAAFGTRVVDFRGRHEAIVEKRTAAFAAGGGGVAAPPPFALPPVAPLRYLTMSAPT